MWRCVCIAGLLLSLLGCQTPGPSTPSVTQGEVRAVIRQEILFFLNWLQARNLLLTNPSFHDWTPKDLGPVDEATGNLLPQPVLSPLYERPQDIPEDIVKELHNAPTHRVSRNRQTAPEA